MENVDVIIFQVAAASKEMIDRIKKLQEDINEQMQRRLQASKALDVCQSKDEFEGSLERVEFERLLVNIFSNFGKAGSRLEIRFQGES